MYKSLLLVELVDSWTRLHGIISGGGGGGMLWLPPICCLPSLRIDKFKFHHVGVLSPTSLTGPIQTGLYSHRRELEA